MRPENRMNYEDTDYQRYYDFYGDTQYVAARPLEDDSPEELLADDAISAAEEGFLTGYEYRGGRDREWL